MGPLERIFCRSSRLIPIFTILLYLASANALFQRIVHGPSNTTVRLNETVVLKCQVENQVGAVQWIKNGFGLGSYREIPLFKRYTMIGSPSLGEYHLQIVNASLEDDDIFECQIDNSNDHPPQTSKPARLSIIAEPQNPYILSVPESKTVKVVEGKPFQLACKSDGGKPAAKLAWVISRDEEGREITNWLGNSAQVLQNTKVHRNSKQFEYDAKVTESIQIDRESGLETAISNLTFIPSQLEDNRYLICLSTHETFGGAVKYAQVFMDVSYPPKAVIKVDEAKSLMREGGQAVLLCHVEAKPKNDLAIFWYKSDRIVSSNNSQTLILPNLRMEDHLSEITCRARNSIGESKASYHLNVSFGPRIMSAPQSKDVERGGSASFHCEALGNPEPEIHWTRKETDDIIAKGKILALDSVQPWHVGAYDCVAQVEGFNPTKISNYLHLKGEPMVQFTRNMIRFDGDNLVMTCEIRGKPFPKHIIWMREGKPINFEESAGRFQAQDVHRDFGVESKLTIIQVTSSDYGLYNCTATNDFGTGSAAAIAEEVGIIDQLKNFQVIAGIPASVLLAILTGVILLGLLAYLLFYICRKLCSNKNKGTRFSDEHSDVTIKCEALDGGHFYPDMYGRSDMDSSDLIITKDYISVPQNNPDLDFLPPPNFIETFHHQRHYLNPPVHPIPDYPHSDTSARFEASYGSFTSGHSMQGLQPPDMYSGGNPNGMLYSKTSHNGPTQLETLTEVATPDTESGTPLINGPNDIRPISRISTHV